VDTVLCGRVYGPEVPHNRGSGEVDPSPPVPVRLCNAANPLRPDLGMVALDTVPEPSTRPRVIILTQALPRVTGPQLDALP
jgi:hypothetical protein